MKHYQLNKPGRVNKPWPYLLISITMAVLYVLYARMDWIIGGLPS